MSFPDTVEHVAERIFGADNVAAATPFIRSFLTEKKRAAEEMPGSAYQEQFNAAVVNWAIRIFTGMVGQIARNFELNQETSSVLSNATVETPAYRASVQRLESLVDKIVTVLELDGKLRQAVGDHGQNVLPIKTKRGGWPKGKKRGKNQPARKAAAAITKGKKGKRK